MPSSRVRALTLDLDDTLWPIAPTIARAEVVVHAWLAAHAPATAARFDIADLQRLREEAARQTPALAHDFTAMRLASLRHALAEAGDDPALAAEAFEVFLEARHQVELYPEVDAALARLASRYPLFALSNGNAEVARTPLAGRFRGALSAREFGVGKPDPRIFLEACRRLGCAPGEVLHVGDDLALDVHGARAAGLQARWLRRVPGHPESGGDTADTDVVAHTTHTADATDTARDDAIETVACLRTLADALGC